MGKITATPRAGGYVLEYTGPVRDFMRKPQPTMYQGYTRKEAIDRYQKFLIEERFIDVEEL